MLSAVLLGLVGVGLLITAPAYRRDSLAANEFIAERGHPMFWRFPWLVGGTVRLGVFVGRALGVACLAAAVLVAAGVLDW
ncbi:MAG: hypothetical protein QOH68_2653 [Nocardioidaceae bacterium]|nr:hypothetical protein [Nocardioidaceae bacterium]